MRLLTLLSLTAVLTLLLGGLRASAQGMPLPSGTNVPVPRIGGHSAEHAEPNVQRSANAGSVMGSVSAGGKLPRTAGQEHRVYDLRPYTGYLTKHDRPEQAIIDWVLRETGTRRLVHRTVWISECGSRFAIGLSHQRNASGRRRCGRSIRCRRKRPASIESASDDGRQSELAKSCSHVDATRRPSIRPVFRPGC